MLTYESPALAVTPTGALGTPSVTTAASEISAENTIKDVIMHKIMNRASRHVPLFRVT
jgi:hypothetical protein